MLCIELLVYLIVVSWFIGRVLYRTCSSSCGCGDLCTNLPFQKLPGCKLKAVKVKINCSIIEFINLA